jgi:polyisoprenoid-binding protein YceI
VPDTLEFDPDNPVQLAIETTIQAAQLWTGEPQRDNHLRSADFLDVAEHRTIAFRSTASKCVGPTDYEVTGDLSIRGMSRPVVLEMHYLGKWSTPYWTDKGDAGPISRVGFVGKTRINRRDFQVSWNGDMANHGVVVSNEVFITVDVEALLESELEGALKK